MVAVKYALFAVISTVINLIVQWIMISNYNCKFSFWIALFAGTLAGLISKYVLDKKFIFFYKSKSIFDDFNKFICYSLMGIFTTLIFWGIEIGFKVIIEKNWSQYVGGFIGLTVGYTVKYFLDKKFVFNGG